MQVATSRGPLVLYAGHDRAVRHHLGIVPKCQWCCRVSSGPGADWLEKCNPCRWLQEKPHDTDWLEKGIQWFGKKPHRPGWLGKYDPCR